VITLKLTSAEVRAITYAISILECDYVDSESLDHSARRMLKAAERVILKIAHAENGKPTEDQ